MALKNYRRVNIDGLMITETRPASAALKPGTFAIINNDNEFENATAGSMGRLYVINEAYTQGLSIDQVVPEGDSAIGNYVEDGRELVCLAGAGTFKKDQSISVGANGYAVAASSTNVVGYVQCDDAFVSSTEQFIRIRFRAAPSVPAPTSVAVTPATASIEVAETLQLSASVSPATASQAVTWASSDTDKATVNAATGLVTGVAAGTATITATSTADSGKTATATITVTA